MRDDNSLSEYVPDLSHANQERAAEERIDPLPLEGLGSGEPIAVTPDFWNAKKKRLVERLSMNPPLNDSTTCTSPTRQGAKWRRP